MSHENNKESNYDLGSDLLTIILYSPRGLSNVGPHGVPSPMNVSKSQGGAKVPTFEPQDTIKIRLIIQ